jgi:hypothetical protein
VNGIIIGRNILAGLRRVDLDRSELYEENERAFSERVIRRTFGDQLVDIFGAETLFDLARAHRLWEFLEEQRLQGKPLTELLGGWLSQGAPFRNRRMVCYHKNWLYFSTRFRIACAMYVEPKVGIPPSPGHVRRVIDFMEENQIPALFAANYFSHNQIESVARRTGAEPVIVPEHVGGAPGVDDYFALIDLWVEELAGAFASAAAGE